MNSTIRNLTLLLMVIYITSCASAPKVALRTEVKQSIKQLALIEIPEPSRYFLDPGQSATRSPLMLFGAIGGAIAGGIDAKRYEEATSKFTAAVLPLKPELSRILLSKLEEGLREKGYNVQRIPPSPMTTNGKGYDLSLIKGEFDAILVPTLAGGYRVESGTVVPKVSSVISLYSKSGNEILFADTYNYYPITIGKSVQIPPDSKYIFNSIDAVYQDISIAVEGLKTGAAKIAERVVADL